MQIQLQVLVQVIDNDQEHEVLLLQRNFFLYDQKILSTYQHHDFLHIQQNHNLKNEIVLPPENHFDLPLASLV